MAKISNKNRQQIILRSLKERAHALQYRQKRESKWQLVDDLYHGYKKPSVVTRANVHIPKMHGGIETFVSKIDDPPYINFEAQAPQDMKRAFRLNALKDLDYVNGDWELVDILGKKMGAKYGRCVFKKYSTSEDGFTDYFDLVDVLDFYIDPTAGGLFPMRHASYLGHDNIIKSTHDLSDPKKYDQEVVEKIATKMTADSQADNDHQSLQKRRQSLGLSQAVLIEEESIRLSEHYTTFNGEKYIVLLAPDFNDAVRVVKLADVYPSGDYPFATWAVYPDALEFWTPGVGELLIEVNIIQNISMSQMLDNITMRNYNMKAYDMTKVPDKSQLIPRPQGLIAVNGDPRTIIQDIMPPEIDQSLALYNTMDRVNETETGLNRQSKGMPNSKRMSATEFAGLIEQTADRFFSANRTYKSAMRRVAQLYAKGIQQNMTKKRQVSILGASNGLEWFEVSKSEIKGSFDVVISTGALMENEDKAKREAKLLYIKENRENPSVNKFMLNEVEALAAGFTASELPRLLNPDLEGDWEIIGEAHEENERLLRGDVESNPGSTTGHVQVHLDFARKTRDLTDEQRERVIKHAKAELEFAAKNEEGKVRELIQKRRNQNLRSAPGEEQPLPPSPPNSEAALAAIQEAQGSNPLLVDESEAVRQEAIAQAPQPLSN
jgi:hypothetical protein